MSRKTLNCNGKLFDLSTPQVMGILNLTPDSFYDGGRWHSDLYLGQVERMLEEGATIIDIGAMSSRPGSDFVSEAEELARLITPLEKIKTHFPEAIISIDTWRSGVLKEAAKVGIHLVNDISGGMLDEKFLETVAVSGLPYVLMHIKGTPKNMQQHPAYEDVLLEVQDYFIAKLQYIRSLGVKDVVLDPGFGFGKTLEQNYQLLAGLSSFHWFELPILVGVSRKSMICKALSVNPEAALNGTTAAHILALQEGAAILRVHDVRAAIEAIKIWNFYKKEQGHTTIIPKFASY